jgi:molybdopterin-containing oxidoreductase family membrane subunit
MADDAVPVREPVLQPGYTFSSVTEKISAVVLSGRTPRAWSAALGVSLALVALLMISITMLLIRGIGIWGVNRTVMWGFAITNFVWWIGIGHAGTLISAILLLLRQSWRTSINRFAEAMTLFAVASAALFPLLHLGRPKFFYWLFPYPSVFGAWPQFRSPLVWDVFAVSTYGIVSFLFWYVGMIPDLATFRDRARSRFAKMFYGVLAMGWRGSARHWKRHEVAYLILSGLATALVVSVHTVVSLDFTAAIVPGWHSTIFPPYFVAGAIFSGFAMVITLAIPLRALYGLQDFITLRHLDNMARLLLATGMIVAYGYLAEAFFAWYGGDPIERSTHLDRLTGSYAPVFWLLLFCNVLVPQIFWSRRMRASIPVLFVASILVNIGMWCERFVIVVQSLSHEYLPSMWRTYVPTRWDVATFAGSLGLFLALFLLFLRFLPSISMAEMRQLVATRTEEGAS